MSISSHLIRLSIVTITYRNSNGLQLTLDSLGPLFAAFSDRIEHLIVDAADDYFQPGFRKPTWPVRHFNLKPGGIYPALNFGAKEAKGQWIWFLNAGDEFSNECMNFFESFFSQKIDQEQVADFDRHYGLIYAGVCLRKKPSQIKKIVLPPHCESEFIFRIVGKNRVCQQALLYNVDFFNKTGEFDSSYRFASDYEHHYRMWIQGVKIFFISSVLTIYDMSGVSNQNPEPVMREFKQVQERFMSQLPWWINLLNIFLWPYERVKVLILSKIRSRFV